MSQHFNKSNSSVQYSIKRIKNFIFLARFVFFTFLSTVKFHYFCFTFDKAGELLPVWQRHDIKAYIHWASECYTMLVRLHNIYIEDSHLIKCDVMNLFFFFYSSFSLFRAVSFGTSSFTICLSHTRNKFMQNRLELVVFL